MRTCDVFGAYVLPACIARSYPWDWAADIGEIPPLAATAGRAVPMPVLDAVKVVAAARVRLGKQPHAAAVVELASGRVLSSAADLRPLSGGNPVNSGAPFCCCGFALRVCARACMRAFAVVRWPWSGAEPGR